MRRGRIRYSARELAFVEARRAMPRRDLRAAFVREFGRTDVSVDDLKSLCSRRGWTTGRERWRPDEDALVRELYPDTRTVDLAARLGRELQSVYRRAQVLGLEKSAAFRASPASGRTNGRQGINTRFTKGHAPANKGLRRPGWAPGRMKETQFKKGVRQGVATKLWKPIGTERLSKEGYLERKIHDGMPLQSRWRAVHRIRWEEVNGPVPKGHALKCLADKSNTDPSNWIAIPRGMLPLLNGVHGHDYDNAPADLKPSILAIARVQYAANQRDGLTSTQRMIKKRRERQRAGAA